MRRVTVFLMLVLTIAAVSRPSTARQCAAATAARAPQVGDMAPDFALPGTDGRTYRLSDYRGKQPVVLVWFARAFSAG